MKKIILFFILCTYSFACLGQILTEEEYSELSNLFQEDVQLMGDSYETYVQYRSTHQQSPFFHTRIITLNENPNLDTI